MCCDRMTLRLCLRNICLSPQTRTKDVYENQKLTETLVLALKCSWHHWCVQHWDIPGSANDKDSTTQSYDETLLCAEI